MIKIKAKYIGKALITGASSGIGLAFAQKLAALGYALILVARSENRLQSLANSLRSEYNINVQVIVADLSLESGLETVKDRIADEKIGVFINNAGYGSVNDFFEIDFASELSMIKLNCLAVYYLARVVAEKMKKAGGGAIIITGSLVGSIPAPFYTTYGATKSFDNQLGLGLYYELKKYNIDVLSLLPGGTTTEFQNKSGAKRQSFYRTPEQVVETALNAVGKKPLVIDGFFNKLVAVFMKLLNRKMAVNLSGVSIAKNEGLKK